MISPQLICMVSSHAHPTADLGEPCCWLDILQHMYREIHIESSKNGVLSRSALNEQQVIQIHSDCELYLHRMPKPGSKTKTKNINFSFFESFLGARVVSRAGNR